MILVNTHIITGKPSSADGPLVRPHAIEIRGPIARSATKLGSITGVKEGDCVNSTITVLIKVGKLEVRISVQSIESVTECFMGP